MKRIALLSLILIISSLTAWSQVAKIIDVHGSVELKQNDTTEWIKAKPQMYLEETAKIKTGDDSSCIITFDEKLKNVIAIQGNTQIELEKIKPVKLFMPKGRIFSIIEDLAGLDEFIIRTPTAIAGVRGTGEYIEFNGIESIIKCFEGKIEVYSLNKRGRKLRKKILKESYATRISDSRRIKKPFKLTIKEYEEWHNFKGTVKHYQKKSKKISIRPKERRNDNSSDVIILPNSLGGFIHDRSTTTIGIDMKDIKKKLDNYGK